MNFSSLVRFPAVSSDKLDLSMAPRASEVALFTDENQGCFPYVAHPVLEKMGPNSSLIGPHSLQQGTQAFSR